MKTLKSYLNFFSNKNYIEKDIMTIRTFLNIIIMMVCFSMLAMFIINIVNTFLYGGNLHVVSSGQERTLLQAYCSAVIIAPILEELTFRLPLLIISKILSKYTSVVFFIFLLISFLFGMIHIINYDNPSHFSTFQTILITLPQIFAGLILGWSCLKYKKGLMWSILLHAGYNFTVITLSQI